MLMATQVVNFELKYTLNWEHLHESRICDTLLVSTIIYNLEDNEIEIVA